MSGENIVGRTYYHESGFEKLSVAQARATSPISPTDYQRVSNVFTDRKHLIGLRELVYNNREACVGSKTKHLFKGTLISLYALQESFDQIPALVIQSDSEKTLEAVVEYLGLQKLSKKYEPTTPFDTELNLLAFSNNF